MRDQVALGEITWGLTDTDDANGAMLDERPVGVTYPTLQSADGTREGIVLIPNTVCLIQGCPNPDAGKRLIDYLLSAEVEEALASGRSAQLPLRPGLTPPPGWEKMAELQALEVDWPAVMDALGPSAQWLDSIYVR